MIDRRVWQGPNSWYSWSTNDTVYDLTDARYVAGHEVRQVYDVDPSTCNHCLGGWVQSYFSEAFFLTFGGGTLPLPVQEYNVQPNLRYNPDRTMTQLNIGWKTNQYEAKKTDFAVFNFRVFESKMLVKIVPRNLLLSSVKRFSAFSF